MDAIKLETVNDNSDFERIVENLVGRIHSVGEVNYDYLREELKKLSVPLDDFFDPKALAKDLSRIQALKDRAIEIVRLLTENYLVHKRVVEILTKGWPKFSVEKSAEKREGEAQLKMANFIMAANDAENAYRHAVGVMRNLESQQETVSRQISCVQAAAKILDSRYAFDSVENLNRGTGQNTEDRRPFEQGRESKEGDDITNWDKTLEP